jgi:RHS repeat-associated protein
VGCYTYHGTKIHAVTAAGGLSFSYDANGNLTTRSGASVTWYASNQPQTISNGSYSSTSEYGPHRNYWKQTATYSNGTETTRYIGGLLEIVQGPSVTSWRHQILASGRTVAIYSRGSNGSNNTIYPLRDHLGSTEAITNASGAIIVKTSFAAYGARRGSNWTGAPSGADMTAIGDATRRGYTDHTMLDNLGLVHMNGRVFDPAIGRFMSADPFIDGVLDTQGWNRFSYVKNNPLTSTDPSGFKTTKEQQRDGDTCRHWLCGGLFLRTNIDRIREAHGFGGDAGDGLDEVTISASRVDGPDTLADGLWIDTSRFLVDQMEARLNRQGLVCGSYSSPTTCLFTEQMSVIVVSPGVEGASDAARSDLRAGASMALAALGLLTEIDVAANRRFDPFMPGVTPWQRMLASDNRRAYVTRLSNLAGAINAIQVTLSMGEFISGYYSQERDGPYRAAQAGVDLGVTSLGAFFPGYGWVFSGAWSLVSPVYWTEYPQSLDRYVQAYPGAPFPRGVMATPGAQ